MRSLLRQQSADQGQVFFVFLSKNAFRIWILAVAYDIFDCNKYN
jgi:hypothetical protein